MSSILPSFCADTGSIHTLLRASDAPHINLPLSPTDTLTVLLPNGQSIRSIGTCHIHFPHLQCPFTAHVFSDSALNTSLLSIAQLCRLGCVATFTSTDVHVTHKQSTVLHGSYQFLWQPSPQMMRSFFSFEAYRLSAGWTRRQRKVVQVHLMLLDFRVRQLQRLG